MFKFRRYGHWYFLSALALGVFVVWSAVFYAESRRGRVFLHVLDVGQGDAIFIEAPGGNQALVDGGPDNSVVARLGEVMPFWDNSIDLVVLTHPHADHLDGLLEVIKRYDVGVIIESGVNHSIPEYAEWQKAIADKGIARLVARRGMIANLGGGAYLKVLSPFDSYENVTVRNVHDAAVVAKLEFASSTALLMADAEAVLERRLLAAGEDLNAEVLKVGHHGSKTSTLEMFLAAARPRFAVISAGRNNRYGHPTQEVLDRLADSGVRTFRTDQDGTVSFASGGGYFVPDSND
ncbi:MAG: MBL fold metallo-hydrolase [Candidatus Sungbacteria bacterium]|uniref:MBL fold metallo-hydrolase n=1 Tax=Candidatus Sungiibacteriota bacterium TaxID=2750080 RepID=A0A931SDD1_9BACT|nr:MBL fold metallo-hydrolase [Candidatus Sungbacteria bacterium]